VPGFRRLRQGRLQGSGGASAPVLAVRRKAIALGPDAGYKPPSRTARQGMPWRFTDALRPPLSSARTDRPVERRSEMPKMKTKSSAKKRFKLTATGKVKSAAAGKRHGMIKRSNKFIRDARGTMVLSDPDARIVKKFLPNSL
jgi:large subunit ribosomal protein L35